MEPFDLFAQNRDAIYNFHFGMTGSEILAADRTVETFHRAFKDAAMLHQQARLQTSLLRIAYETFLHRNRRTRCQLLHRAAGSVKGARAMRLDDDPDRTAEHEHTALQSAIIWAIQDLPERQRCVVVLQKLQRSTDDEIAQVLRCSTREVGVLLIQAHAHLRKRLSAFVGQPPTAGTGPAGSIAL